MFSVFRECSAHLCVTGSSTENFIELQHLWHLFLAARRPTCRNGHDWLLISHKFFSTRRSRFGSRHRWALNFQQLNGLPLKDIFLNNQIFGLPYYLMCMVAALSLPKGGPFQNVTLEMAYLSLFVYCDARGWECCYKKLQFLSSLSILFLNFFGPLCIIVLLLEEQQYCFLAFFLLFFFSSFQVIQFLFFFGGVPFRKFYSSQSAWQHQFPPPSPWRLQSLCHKYPAECSHYLALFESLGNPHFKKLFQSSP